MRRLWLGSGAGGDDVFLRFLLNARWTCRQRRCVPRRTPHPGWDGSQQHSASLASWRQTECRHGSRDQRPSPDPARHLHDRRGRRAVCRPHPAGIIAPRGGGCSAASPLRGSGPPPSAISRRPLPLLHASPAPNISISDVEHESVSHPLRGHPIANTRRAIRPDLNRASQRAVFLSGRSS